MIDAPNYASVSLNPVRKARRLARRGAREPIGWHPYLDLAKKHADRIGAVLLGTRQQMGSRPEIYWV